MAVVALCLAACAQRKDGDKSFDDKKPRNGNGMMVNKDTDSVYAALKNETLDKFEQFIYEDAETGKTMQYNLFVPDAYDGKQNYPLVLFMADASTVGKDVTTPLSQGYGALEFASKRDQQMHPSFVLVPQYTEWTVGEGEVKSDEVEMTIRMLQSVMENYSCFVVRQLPVGHHFDALFGAEEVLLCRGRRRRKGF